MNGVHRKAELFGEHPGRRETQGTGDEPPAVLMAPHQQKVFLYKPRGGQQRGLAAERDKTTARQDSKRGALAPIGLRIARQQMRGEQFQNLRLPRFAAVKRAEGGGALILKDSLLERELFGEKLVLLDPISEIDRREADRERRLAGGIRGVKEGHETSNDPVAERTLSSTTSKA
jgi:hypothetical protein